MSEIPLPIAKKIPVVLEKHGDKRVDNYFWMNQRDHEDVLAYLNAENDYNDAMTAHTKAFQQQLFEEMKSRIKEQMNQFHTSIMAIGTLRVMKKEKIIPSIHEKRNILMLKRRFSLIATLWLKVIAILSWEGLILVRIIL